MLATMVWRVSLSFNGLGLSEPEPCWGIPHSRSCSSTVFNIRSRCEPLLLPFFSASIHTGDYPPPVGVNTDYHLRSENLHLDLPFPLSSTRFKLVMSTHPLHGEGDRFSPPSTVRSTVLPPVRSTEPTILLLPYSLRPPFRRCSSAGGPYYRCRGQNISEIGLGQYLLIGMLSPCGLSYLILNPTASKLTFVWGSLAFMTNLLMIFGGFTEVITEACMYTLSNLSYRKSFPRFHLLVDSSGQSTSSSSLSSFSPELVAILSPVFPPNTKWRCVSLSLIVLSSCVAVRTGPEDATDIVSMIFRDADWILTSQYKVTKFQVSGAAVFLASTHLSLASSSLSFYLRGFSTSSLYGLLFVAVRVWLNSFACSLNV